MQVQLEFRSEEVPIMEGAREASEQGVASSLYAQNALVGQQTEQHGSAAEAAFQLLVDPQTGAP